MNKVTWIASVFFGILFVFILIGLLMGHIEQPQYRVLSQDGPIEVRDYPTMIVAQVHVHGTRQVALREGFQLLAGYISGSNRLKQKIKMTAPVMQQKIDQGWRVQFMMPSSYTLNTLPLPENSRVQLQMKPPQKQISLRFSGRALSGQLNKQGALLTQYTQQHAIKTLGHLIYAFYNPPWTLPFLRRNEVSFLLNLS